MENPALLFSIIIVVGLLLGLKDHTRNDSM